MQKTTSVITCINPPPNKKTNSRACAVLVPKGFKTKKTTLAYFLHTDIYEVYM